MFDEIFSSFIVSLFTGVDFDFFFLYYVVFFFFFFFQAEDGIRDIGVTGVQTCALPISKWVGAIAGSSTQRVSATWLPLVMSLAETSTFTGVVYVPLGLGAGGSIPIRVTGGLVSM